MPRSRAKRNEPRGLKPPLLAAPVVSAPQVALRWLVCAIVGGGVALLTACNGGVRPTLVNDPPATTQPELEIDLPAAPQGTTPLPPTSADFPLEASVDDALLAWAADRSVPYIDSCAIVTPAPGALCDVPTERDTVRLLGPTADEIWYIVRVLETDSFDFGTGYRVSQVEIAGQ